MDVRIFHMHQIKYYLFHSLSLPPCVGARIRRVAGRMKHSFMFEGQSDDNSIVLIVYSFSIRSLLLSGGMCHVGDRVMQASSHQQEMQQFFVCDDYPGFDQKRARKAEHVSQMDSLPLDEKRSESPSEHHGMIAKAR